MDGLTAVVTGADRDVGEAVARRFAAAGARVVVAARDADELDDVVEGVEARNSDGDDDDSDGNGDGDRTGNVESVRADVRDEYDVERLMELAARESDGGIDVVAACAEVFHGEQGGQDDQSERSESGGTPLTAESYAAFDDTLRTNARGVFATIREAVPHLADDARVLVPAGSRSVANQQGGGSYAVSKAAAAAVTRGFAAELDAAVGVVDSDAAGSSADDPEARGGPDPETVADLFAWAATEAPAEDVDGEVVGLAAYESAEA